MRQAYSSSVARTVALRSAGLIAGIALHHSAEYLLELARGCHKAAKALRLLGQEGSAEQFDARRRVLLDDARQARRRRPHGPRCDERAGYAFHVCAKDRRHTGDCRCRCGEEFGPPF